MELADIQEVVEFDATVSPDRPPQTFKERVNALFVGLSVDLSADKEAAVQRTREGAQAALDKIDPTTPMPQLSAAAWQTRALVGRREAAE